MPWKVFKRGDTYKVYKVDSDGEPVGEALGTHETEKEAAAQARALYANEPDAKSAVKFAAGSKTDIEGLLCPYGGPHNGRDIAGEYFSVKTDFALDWFEGDRPLLYHHGLDSEIKTSVIGRIKSLSKTDLGLWMQAQLDANHEYYAAIAALIDDGKVGLSSGSMRHLVQVDRKSGEILRWPLIEGSTTPTPCNILADVGFAEAKSHYKSIGLELPAKIMDDMATKTIKAVSWEAIRQECTHMIEQQLAMAVPWGDSAGYCYVDGTYSDHIVCCICKNDLERHYSVPFEVGEDGHVTKLGQPVEVEQGDWQPVEHPMDNIPMGMHAEMAKAYVGSLLERTKDLRERRIKEGRVLSMSTRKRLGQCLEAMRGAADEMAALLDSTEPPAKAGDVLRLQAQAMSMSMRAKTLMWR